MEYETILYSEDGPVGTLTLNRPEDGNMFTETMCHEVRDCINAVRRELAPAPGHYRCRRPVFLHRRAQDRHAGYDALRRRAADSRYV